jgi:hypothetical protein
MTTYINYLHLFFDAGGSPSVAESRLRISKECSEFSAAALSPRSRRRNALDRLRNVIRQYLGARHIDELHLAFSPVFLGKGEHLLSGRNLSQLGYTPTRTIAGENATHIWIERK